VTATTATATASRLRRHRGRRQGPALLLLAPAFAVIGVLVLYPLGVSLWDSLHADNALLPSRAFTGGRNYSTVLHDPSFIQAGVNTLGYLVIVTLGAMLAGLGIAFWLHSVARLRAVALTVIVLPWAVPGIVTGALWSFILSPSGGLLNGILQGLHLISHPEIWLEGRIWGIFFISLSLIWQITPICAVIFLAGLESIPTELYEEAAVEGAGSGAVLRRITLPLLRPSLAIGLLQASVLAIGIFDQVVVLAGYSPGSISVVMQLYLYAFRDLNFGLGMAASMIVTAGTLLVSLIYIKGVYREVNY
jgi:ABC-type sugar transport system permease subunit